MYISKLCVLLTIVSIIYCKSPIKRITIDLASETLPTYTGCQKGYHSVDDKCKPNTDYCKDDHYDSNTYNCAECEWYAFWVENDTGDRHGSRTGNYCETRWWIWVLGICGTI